ncbi:MAG TPA: tetratricopeptide repeat protein, partial [Candidatus Dormibacteraeota bacterium]|nr:tetratricopeptide repeat protein [Candidatus Dormibacteraeota bacterium]
TTANERAELELIKGTALNQLGRQAEALVVLQGAAATVPPDDPELNAGIYAEIARVLNEQEQFNSAVEAGLRSLRWLDRTRHADPALRARVLTNLGRSSWSLGQLQQSHKFHIQALHAATDAESLFRIANAHMALGVTARATGRLDQAIEHCNRALELHARIKQERTANRILNNIGDVHYAAGRLEQARDVQERCLRRGRELKDDTVIGFAGCALARYDLDQNRIAEANARAREARLAARRANDHLRQALALALEAEAEERRGQRGKADRRFAIALRMLSERNAGQKLAEVATIYADALRRRGDDSRAFALMRMAAERDFDKLRTLIKAGR